MMLGLAAGSSAVIAICDCTRSDYFAAKCLIRSGKICYEEGMDNTPTDRQGSLSRLPFSRAGD